MRKLFTMVLMLAIVAGTSFMIHAESLSQAGPGKPLDVAEAPMNTFIDNANVASPTVAVTGTARLIGTKPAGAHAVYIVAVNGALRVGNASVTVDLTGVPIASGSYLKLNLRKDLVNPSIYVNGNATARMLYVK